ncbi:hypothetical protein LOD99_16247 [Oopsacas minuta]|uniref:Uncharacterized protein n=1 Tax=Oopsacas minuta TaxID=111878 RepID=A0AAV7K7M6_9METZ|nr:hypothetical protein LOD99_16247 [Oopsacas minuta]
MAEILTSSIQSDQKDFELEAVKIATKIHTYFSQLIEVIKLRRIELISELSEVITHYRQEQDKMKELELKRSNQERSYTHSDRKLSDIESELARLRENSTVFIEFEWDRKYAREASAIGKFNIRSFSTILNKKVKTEISEFSTTPRSSKIFPSTSRDGGHEISSKSKSNEQSIASIQASPNYQRYTDISPDKFTDNQSFKQVRPPPYNPGYSKHTSAKRVCIEGYSAPIYRADGADRPDRTGHIDTVTQTKFEL